LSRTRIKICGITRPEDARVAVDRGADALGLVFYPESPRAVSLEQAADVAAEVPPFVSLVALFVDATATRVREVLDALPVGLVQFHGEETPSYCRQFGRPWIKALRVRPDSDVAAGCRPYHGARGILLDAWQEGVPGGTGKAFDWRIVRGQLPHPIVLAGGLNADNVGAAVSAVRPFAVDVSGGVEQSPGVKDANKIGEFIAAVQTADREGWNRK